MYIDEIADIPLLAQMYDEKDMRYTVHVIGYWLYKIPPQLYLSNCKHSKIVQTVQQLP